MVIAGSLLVLPLLALSVGAAQNEIYGVNVVPGEGIVRIEISKAGDVTFNAFMMNEPDRLVVNCVGAVYNVPWQEKTVQSSLVNKVRTSQFQVDPLVISRIVVDLASPAEYRMYAEGTKQIVEITSREAAAPVHEAAETVRLLEPVSVTERAKHQDRCDQRDRTNAACHEKHDPPLRATMASSCQTVESLAPQKRRCVD